jgi:hypothetical protein
VSADHRAIERERVAQVVVDFGPGRIRRRASGYRVTPSTVLTAGHAIGGARAVTVIFNAELVDEWSVQATVAFAEPPPADVGVLCIVPRPWERIAPVSFGRVAQQADVLRCTAVGFPRWKTRIGSGSAAIGGNIAPYRDSHQADGTIAGLSNLRQGTLEIRVEPPEKDADPSHSPWEGMSGAAVWSSGSVVGLVSEHHVTDGLSRLAGVRVERWYERLAPRQLHRLCDLTGLPDDADRLVAARSWTAAGQAESSPARARTRADRHADPVPLPLPSVGRIVDQMLRVEELANPTSLHHFLSLLPTDILGTLSYASQSRAQLVNVVRKCRRAGADGRRALVDALSLAVAGPELSDVLSVLNSEWPTAHDEAR